jgi:hypothetical protein
MTILSTSISVSARLSALMLGISCLDTQGLAGIITALFGLIGVALMLFGVASLMARLALLYRPELRERTWLWLTTRHEPTGVRSSESGDSERSSESGDSDKHAGDTSRT